MAIAEAIYSSKFGQLRTNVRIRGGSLLGTAIGTGIGVAQSAIFGDWDYPNIPFPDLIKPNKPRQGAPFAQVNGVSSQANAGAYKQHQAFRTSTKGNYRKRRNLKHDCRPRCRCTC